MVSRLEKGGFKGLTALKRGDFQDPLNKAHPAMPFETLLETEKSSNCPEHLCESEAKVLVEMNRQVRMNEWTEWEFED